jgi:peptide/nickel transport system substrate-binding protein
MGPTHAASGVTAMPETLQKLPRTRRKFAERVTIAARALQAYNYGMPSSLARVVVLVGLVLFARVGEAGAQGILRVGVPALPATLDPALAADAAAGMVFRQLFDTLLQYREGSSDVEAGLAIQWHVSRDGLAWSFRLRDGVRFHDGTPLSASEVATSLERVLFPGAAHAPSANPVVPRLLRGAPGVVKAIKVPDSRTVQISLNLPYAPLLTVLAHPALSIVRPATGADGSKRWLGTGAFLLADAAPGRLVLEANPAYWGGAPRSSRVVFTEASDEARATADLDARALDVFVPLGAPARMSGALAVPSWRIGYLALQSEREPFLRKRIRQGVAAALDQAALAPVLEPYAVPLTTPLPSVVWGYQPAAKPPDNRAETARKLLAEGGALRAISVGLMVTPLVPPLDGARVAEALRAALAPGGVNITVTAVTPETALRLAQNGEHQIALAEAQVDGGDPHLLLYPLSTSEGARKGALAWNLSFYRNPRLDDLLIRGSQLSGRLERQRVYARAQALLADEAPWLPLYTRLHWVVARPEVRNLRLHPSGFHRLDRVLVEGGAARP